MRAIGSPWPVSAASVRGTPRSAGPTASETSAASQRQQRQAGDQQRAGDRQRRRSARHSLVGARALSPAQPLGHGVEHDLASGETLLRVAGGSRRCCRRRRAGAAAPDRLAQHLRRRLSHRAGRSRPDRRADPLRPRPELSPARPGRPALPITAGSVEEVLALDPDLVIASPFRAAGTRWRRSRRAARGWSICRRRAIFRRSYANVRRMAAAVGHPERGEALIARMRRAARRDRAAARPWPNRGLLSAARLSDRQRHADRRDDPPRRAGQSRHPARPAGAVAHAARGADRGAAGFRPARRRGGRSAPDRGAEMLRHPALDAAVPASRRLRLNQALAVCDGPYFPTAIAALARDIRAADRGAESFAAVHVGLDHRQLQAAAGDGVERRVLALDRVPARLVQRRCRRTRHRGRRSRSPAW